MTLQQIKRKIKHWVEKWYPQIGDLRLELSVNWLDSPDKRSGCEVNEQYLWCELGFSPTRVIAVYTNTESGGFDNDGMEKEVIHECAHTIPWRMAQRLSEAGVSEKEVERLEEQATTMIDRAIWNAYKLGQGENHKRVSLVEAKPVPQSGK